MRILFLLLLFTCPAWALTLADQLQQAEVGDYLVTHQGRSYTVLLVESKGEGTVRFEEITVPQVSKPPRMSWLDWLKKGAKGHSSWVAYDIDPKTGKLSNYYSYSRGGWVDVAQTDQFLTTLLTLHFRAVEEKERKRTGGSGRVWSPPLYYQGKKYKNIPFDAWTATWPKDGSIVSGKTITIYIPSESGAYPSHFPYWIEVTPALAENKIRVVDSGKRQ